VVVGDGVALAPRLGVPQKAKVGLRMPHGVGVEAISTRARVGEAIARLIGGRSRGREEWHGAVCLAHKGGDAAAQCDAVALEGGASLAIEVAPLAAAAILGAGSLGDVAITRGLDDTMTDLNASRGEGRQILHHHRRDAIAVHDGFSRIVAAIDAHSGLVQGMV